MPINVTTPPNVSIPAVPQGFVPPAKRAFFGYYVTQAELEAAPLVLTDLGNFTDYSVVLGAAAPPVSTVVGTLTAALQWRAMRAATDAWQAYVTAQDAIAWKAALTVLDEVKTLFEIAQKRTAALPTQYVGLAQMFDAGKVTAAEAQATRKKNAKDKATAAKNAAAATSATGNAGTLPATTAASSGTATAVPVAPKSTTVTTF